MIRSVEGLESHGLEDLGQGGDGDDEGGEDDTVSQHGRVGQLTLHLSIVRGKIT